MMTGVRRRGHKRKLLAIAATVLVSLLLFAGALALFQTRRLLVSLRPPQILTPPAPDKPQAVNCARLMGEKGLLENILPPMRLLEGNDLEVETPVATAKEPGVGAALGEFARQARSLREEGEKTSRRRWLEVEEARLAVVYQKKATALGKRLRKRREQMDHEMALLRRKVALVKIQWDHLEKTLRTTPWLQQPTPPKNKKDAAVDLRQKRDALKKQHGELTRSLRQRQKRLQQALEEEEKRLLATLQKEMEATQALLRQQAAKATPPLPKEALAEVGVAARVFEQVGQPKTVRPTPMLEDRTPPSRLLRGPTFSAPGVSGVTGGITFRECFWSVPGRLQNKKSLLIK